MLSHLRIARFSIRVLDIVANAKSVEAQLVLLAEAACVERPLPSRSRVRYSIERLRTHNELGVNFLPCEEGTWKREW